MFKRSLLAVAVLSLFASSSFADVFLSFDQGDQARSSAIGSANFSDGTGSAFIFSNADFQFDAFDLDFSIVDNSVISITEVTIFNDDIPNGFSTGPRWNSPLQAGLVVVDDMNNDDPADDVLSTTLGRLLAVSVTEIGINPLAAGVDPNFDTPANAFLLAQIDFDIVGTGTVDINLELGENQFFSNGEETQEILLSPAVAGGTLTVAAVPEPSAMGVLVLAMAGFVVRRRR